MVSLIIIDNISEDECATTENFRNDFYEENNGNCRPVNTIPYHTIPYHTIPYLPRVERRGTCAILAPCACKHIGK